MLLALATLLFVAGCERSDTSPFTAEIDEPGYRRGKELIKQGRNQEALSEFQKVIDKRGLSNAPESHLEVGLLYQYHIKDPVAAIYHYRKFRELKPNSQQADLVRQRIDSATRDFAKTLPGQPMENQLDRLDMSDLVQRLQRENERLKADLAAVRAGKNVADTTPEASGAEGDNTPTATPASAPERPTYAASNDVSPVVRATEENDPTPAAVTPVAPARPAAAPVQTPVQQPQQQAQPARYQPPATVAASTSRPTITQTSPATTRPAASPPPASTSAAPRPATTTANTAARPAATPTPNNATTTARPPVGAYRRHTIAKGETLYSLAQRYYGNRARWSDIYAANRDVMRSPTDYKVGMELKIPQ